MTASDVDVVKRGLTTLLDACRTKGVTDELADIEVSEHQARILRQLDHEDPAMVGELADFFGVTPSTMSLNLRRLEDAGYVRRTRDPDDRRVVNVRLTEMGHRVKDASAVLDVGRVDALLQSLRPDERARALDGLRLLLEGAHRLSSRADGYVGALTGESRGSSRRLREDTEGLSVG